MKAAARVCVCWLVGWFVCVAVAVCDRRLQRAVDHGERRSGRCQQQTTLTAQLVRGVRRQRGGVSGHLQAVTVSCQLRTSCRGLSDATAVGRLQQLAVVATIVIAAVPVALSWMPPMQPLRPAAVISDWTVRVFRCVGRRQRKQRLFSTTERCLTWPSLRSPMAVIPRSRRRSRHLPMHTKVEVV